MRRLRRFPLSVASLCGGLAISLLVLGSAGVAAASTRLRAPEPPLLANDARLGERGVLNDWWTSETIVVDRGRVERALRRADARFGPKRRRGTGWKKSCGALPQLPLERAPGWRKRAIRYQRTTLAVAAQQQLWLKVGGEGRTTVWLDGRQVLDWTRAHHALPDDALVPLVLAPGRHELLVRSVYPKFHWRYEPRLLVRLDDTRHRPARGIAVVSPRCSLGDDLSFTLALTPTRNGFGLRAELHALGSHRPLPGRGTLQITAPSTVTLIAVRPSPPRLAPICKETAVPRERERRCRGNRCKEVLLRFPGAATVEIGLEWGPAGRRSIRQTRRVVFHPAVHKALADAELAFTRANKLPRASLVSIRYAYQHLRRLTAELDEDTSYLEALARELAQLTRALDTGADPYARRRGHFLKAYCSPLDGRLQPYSLVVPKRYDGTRALPLIIALHAQGSFPTLAVRRLFGHFAKKGEPLRPLMRHLPTFAQQRAIVVAPHLYGDTGGRYFGARDLFRVLREVERDYRIDRRRIYLTGMSMGALATFHLGLRHPTRWAALATMAGYASVKLYRELRGVKLYPFEKPLLEEREDTNYGINGRYLPLDAWHGSRDDPYHSEAMVSVYRKLGYRVEFQTPAWGHRVWQLGYKGGRIFGWLLRHRRPEKPRRVVFRSGSYRQRSAYWLRIDRFGTLQKLGLVRAEIEGKRLTIRSENIVRLTVLWREAPSRTGTIVIDGVRLQLAIGSSATTTLSRERGGRWRLVSAGEPPQRGLDKRPGRSGPIPDVRFDAQLFVYGTARDDETPINRQRAESDARYRMIRADVRLPVKRDRDVTAQDIARYHLVLYGTPRGNTLLARILPKLPLQIGERAIRLGGVTFSGANLGVALVYPNPLNPSRYVLIQSGTTWRGVLATRYLPRWLPDYVVFEERGINRQLGGKLLDKRRVLGAGYFDERWRFDPKRLWRSR